MYRNNNKERESEQGTQMTAYPERFTNLLVYVCIRAF